MSLSEKQLERLNQLKDYAEKQRLMAAEVAPDNVHEEAERWTNVLTWVILIRN